MAGDVYIAGDTAFELYYFSQASADAYASMVNTVHARLGSGVGVYDLLAPTSFGVCLDENIQEQMGASSQKDAFQYIYSRLDPGVKKVDVFDELVRHNAEYIYFRTDHHWTQLGAYYAYRIFAEQKGIRPHELSEFEHRTYPDFLGSFYAYSNQAEALAANPDTLETYTPMGTNDALIQPAEGEPFQWFVVSVFGSGIVAIVGIIVLVKTVFIDFDADPPSLRILLLNSGVPEERVLYDRPDFGRVVRLPPNCLLVCRSREDLEKLKRRFSLIGDFEPLLERGMQKVYRPK